MALSFDSPTVLEPGEDYDIPTLPASGTGGSLGGGVDLDEFTPDRSPAPEPDPAPEPVEDPPENFEGSLPGPGGTPTTSPVSPDDFALDPVGPGDLFTPEPDQNTRTGSTQEDASKANKKKKNATEDVSDEVVQTNLETKGSTSSPAPWYDPFGWFTGSADGGGGAGGSLPVGSLALGAAALALIYASTQ
jgi:hypothetical protein